MSEAIKQYRQLREKVDEIASRLTEMHNTHILCKTGCCGCCINLTVWPVEFFSILEEMKENRFPKIQWNSKKPCGFLNHQDRCLIYPFRPLICRTHGLPLVYMADPEKPNEYGVSFCEKNFKKIDWNTFTFGPDNTFNLDELNDKLARINITFLEERNVDSTNKEARIELRELIDYL